MNMSLWYSTKELSERPDYGVESFTAFRIGLIRNTKLRKSQRMNSIDKTI